MACVVLIHSREASLPCICDNGLQFTEYEGKKIDLYMSMDSGKSQPGTEDEKFTYITKYNVCNALPVFR